MTPRRFAKIAHQRVEIGLARCGQGGEVVPRDRFVTGVVLASEEPRSCRNDDAAFGESRPHFGAVGHCREHTRIRPAVAARAGAAIVGSGMRVIEAVRAMADDDDKRREVLRQPERAQEAGDAFGLFVIAETCARAGGEGASRSPLMAACVASGRSKASRRRRSSSPSQAGASDCKAMASAPKGRPASPAGARKAYRRASHDAAGPATRGAVRGAHDDDATASASAIGTSAPRCPA